MSGHNEIKVVVEAYVSLEEAHADGAFLWADTWPHDTPPACLWRDTGSGTTGLPGHLETTKAIADRFATLWNAFAGLNPSALAGLIEAAENGVGPWLSGALEDPKVCDAMKADINAFFAALANLRGDGQEQLKEAGRG